LKTITSPARPQIGVGVIVVRDGRVLLGKRVGSHGAGTWAFPGGHLEFGESIEACARRELAEETGLQLDAIFPGPYTNDVMAAEGRHYVTCYVQGNVGAGEPKVMEPDKCERWEWFAWTSLPSPLFQPVQNLVAQGLAPDVAAAEKLAALAAEKHLRQGGRRASRSKFDAALSLVPDVAADPRDKR
jgi:8-oxo-dGTP diphosphatase